METLRCCSGHINTVKDHGQHDWAGIGQWGFIPQQEGEFMTAAVFLDRDDTLIQDTGYMYKPEEFAWNDGAEDSLRLFQQHGLPVFIVTNQGGIARAYFTEAQMHIFHDKLLAETVKIGGHITDIAFCPHHPLSVTEALRTPCSCRKPEPGMILSLAKKWQLDLRRSVMIGDKPSDVEAGQAAGCASYLVGREQSLLEVAEQAVSVIASRS